MDGAGFEPVHVENYVDDVDVSDRIVQFEGKLWYVKSLENPDVMCRELLAPLLGAGVANIAEARRRPDPSELLRCDGSIWVPQKPHELICRFVPGYPPDELPITDLDVAVAYELIYSLWIRRRDTHAGNKDFVGNIPVFFDHGVAFDGEEGYERADRFFDPTEDAGHAGRWRLRAIPSGTVVDVRALRREHKEKQLAIHLVHDCDRTRAAFAKVASWIESLTEAQIRFAIQEAGMAAEQADKVARLLLSTQATLRADIELLQRVLDSEPSTDP